MKFHWGEDGADDFDENATREQLRDYLTVLDLVSEFKADCVGWQYQLGLVPLRPPSDFAEGLLNSVCRPESNGDVIITSTEGDQGNLVPMELMKRLLKTKGLHQAVMFHDVRWGAEYQGRFLWVLLNSGSCGGYAMSGDPDTLRGVHSYRQPAEYFPIPGGTFAGEARPGHITWARAYLKDDEMWMDVGRGEVVTLPEQIREQWWRGTTRAVAVHGSRSGHLARDPDGALSEQPHRGGVRRHPRGNGRALANARLQSSLSGKERMI